MTHLVLPGHIRGLAHQSRVKKRLMKCDEMSKNQLLCLNFPSCTMVLGIDYECIHII